MEFLRFSLVDDGMTTTSAARSIPLPQFARVRLTEARRSFHDRVLDGIRRFLEAHAMQ